MKDKDDEWYSQPDNVVGVLVNPITGKPASDSDEKKIIEYMLKVLNLVKMILYLMI